MWIKLCLLLVYVCLLFLLSRLLETISWCDLNPGGVLSRQLLDPMRLSVAKLKCLLDHRGVSFEGIVEKSELTSLVEASGPVNVEDVGLSCEEDVTLSETNFTSGAHFIEQVEDAKDSVWLVQVVTHTDQVKVLMNRRWRNIQRKASYFGVRTGLLDCSLDKRYCRHRGWKVPTLLLALPSVFENKANVIMYNFSGPATENAVMRWMHDKLDARITRIKDLAELQPRDEDPSSQSLQPQIQAVLFTQAISAPLFFSALSVKFPGRVKFGLVTVDESKQKKTFLQKLSNGYNMIHLPLCVIYTAESNYTYGFRLGERFSFGNMEIFLKFLYPCLNDIFIISFCVANVISWFEFFVSNCPVFKRFRKLIWCVLKYNLMVIMLWLPIIGIFQMPYLDQVPLLLLKLHRMFTTSDVGAVLRGDYVFFVHNPIYVYLSFIAYLIVVTLLCKKYREVEDDSEDWFNYRHMQTLTHLRANNLFEPMSLGSYDLVGGFEVFGSRFSQQSLWLQPSIPLEYIQHLPTWRYIPQLLASRAAQNTSKVESALINAGSDNSMSASETQSALKHDSEEKSSEKCHSTKPSSDVTSSDTPKPDQNLLVQPDASTSSASSLHASNLFTMTSHENNGQESSAPLYGRPCTERSAKSESAACSTKSSNSIVNPCQTDSSVSAKTSQQNPALPSPNRYEESPCVAGQGQPDVLPSGFRRGFMESHQCVICLDDYVPHTMLCGLPCGHVFHEKCIIHWLNGEKHFCPMCRWPSYKLMNTTLIPS